MTDFQIPNHIAENDQIAVYIGQPIDLVSSAEIAQHLRVKKETVHAWRYRGILPAPDFDLAVGPVWLWSTIEEWAKETGRL